MEQREGRELSNPIYSPPPPLLPTQQAVKASFLAFSPPFPVKLR